MIGNISRFAATLLAGLTLCLLGAAPAQAQWLRAESPNFIVYANTGERTLRDYVQKLESYDRVLRVRFSMPLDETAARKLPIYLVRDQRELRQAYPGAGDTIAGVYIADTEGPYALAVREGGDTVLLHEYIHHFIHQHFSSTYPGWLTEGLAEYFMTARFRRGYVDIGLSDPNRFSWLAEGSWLPLEQLLTRRPHEVLGGPRGETYYPLSWLLTHWFMASPEQARRLQAYLNALHRGQEPVPAMEAATGMSIAELTRTLRAYMRGRMSYVSYPDAGIEAPVAITRLPDSARDLLLFERRLAMGAPRSEHPQLLAEAQRRAARHPDDPLALMTLGRAGLNYGDPEGGAAALDRLLTFHPDYVAARQMRAMSLIRQAQRDQDNATPLLNAARGHLVHALEVEADHYYTYFLVAVMRQGQPSYPNEADLEAWRMAYETSPQATEVRVGYASALIMANRPREAISLLSPLAGAPHGGGGAVMARHMIEQARSGGGVVFIALRGGEEEAPPEDQD